MSDSVLTITRNYLDLTKPRLLPMVLFTGLPVLGMAAGGWPNAGFTFLVMTGIALAAASANTLNAYIERDKDALMERTKTRPLPAGLIAPRSALVFGLALGVLSTILLYLVSGAPSALVGVASILFYVFVYTVWVKPRSSWNVVVGGAAGAVSPLIADAALNGTVGPAGLSLFALVFFWQPPHVWAIALYRKSDYQAAGIPMLPNVVGDGPTRWWMLVCTLFLIPVTWVPVWYGLIGNLYLGLSLVANGWFIWHAIQVIRLKTHESARAMFRVSLGYLFALLGAMLIDLALTAV